MKDAKPHDRAAVTSSATREVRGQLRVWLSLKGELDYLHSNPGCFAYGLCILGQVTYPLWASVSSSVQRIILVPRLRAPGRVKQINVGEVREDSVEESRAGDLRPQQGLSNPLQAAGRAESLGEARVRDFSIRGIGT